MEVRNDIRIQKTDEPDVLQTSEGRLTLSLPNHLTLFDLAVDPPALWDEQRARLTVGD